MPSNKLFPTDEEKQQLALQEYTDSLRLPVEIPPKAKVSITDKLFGLNGQERYQTWPEKMVRSAVTLPGDVMSGKEPIIDPATGHTSQNVIERAQDVAGMAGGTMFASPKGAVGAMGGKLIPVDHDPFAIAKPFYSAVEHAVTNNNQAKMTGDQWLGTLSNAKGVKPEELQWTGLSDFLAENKGKPVSKQEVQDHLNSNKIELKEVSKGNNPDLVRWKELDNKAVKTSEERAEYLQLSNSKNIEPTKYHDYQLPGGENYREMLLTLPARKGEHGLPEGYKLINENDAAREAGYDVPVNAPDRWAYSGYGIGSQIFKTRDEAIAHANKTAEQMDNAATYKSSHWDEPNILAHVRMNDRTIDGKKSLHLEEIQSDWHQQGREKGYREGNPKFDFRNFGDYARQEHKYTNDEVQKAWHNSNDPVFNEWDKHSRNEIDRQVNHNKGVPDAPFKKSWHELALKRMIREAAEKGYDRLSWTPGEAQAARYDLSKSVDKVQWSPDTETLLAYKDGSQVINKAATAKELPDIVGKEAAKKLLETEGKTEGKSPVKYHVLEGQDLKIGGEGMKGFYDQIIPKSIEKIGKEHGVKVQRGEVEYGGNPHGNKYGWEKDGTDGRYYITTPEGRLGPSFATRQEAQHEMKSLMQNKTKQPIHYIDIPQSLKDTAMKKGFSLFSGGVMYTPVDNDPWDKKK